MKKCPGTILSDCKNNIEDSKSPICKECRSLLDTYVEVQTEALSEKRAKEISLTNDLKGKLANTNKMLAAGWHEQASNNYFFGLPRNKGLWAKVLHSGRSSELPVIILQLNEEYRVDSVAVAFFQMNPDGSMCPLMQGLTDSEFAKAVEECKNIW